MTTLTDRAISVLHEWVGSESLRRHCYAVADSMRHFAQLQGADADLWEAVGLLHDMDYERHPNQEQSEYVDRELVDCAQARAHREGGESNNRGGRQQERAYGAV